MPLWAKTHVVLSGAYGFYSTFNGIFPIVTPGEIDKNMYKSDLYTERIMAATFGAAAAICWIPTVPLLIGKTVCQAERILRNM
jgi:hypothetical protein